MPPISDAASPDAVLADVGARTLDLVHRAGLLTDGEVIGPSSLPGWTRGHVLAHLAQNADAFAAALRRARDADAGAMYPSREARDRDVETGSRATAAQHLTRLIDSADRLATAWRDLPADRTQATLTGTAGWTRPVADIPWMRWRELALHGVDLGWPAGFVAGDPLVGRLLDEAVDSWTGRSDAPGFEITDTDRGRSWQVGGGGVRVDGGTGDLALWLTGRTDGATLTASGPLPALPPWL